MICVDGRTDVIVTATRFQSSRMDESVTSKNYTGRTNNAIKRSDVYVYYNVCVFVSTPHRSSTHQEGIELTLLNKKTTLILAVEFSVVVGSLVHRKDDKQLGHFPSPANSWSNLFDSNAKQTNHDWQLETFVLHENGVLLLSCHNGVLGASDGVGSENNVHRTKFACRSLCGPKSIDPTTPAWI